MCLCLCLCSLAHTRVIGRCPQTEDGWERGVKILGEADSKDPDERKVEFPDGSVDDWGVDDFVLVKKAPPKKRGPRYSVIAKQAIRVEPDPDSDLIGVEKDPRTWIDEGQEIGVLSKKKVKGKTWVQFERGWLAVRDPKNGKELLRPIQAKRAAA